MLFLIFVVVSTAVPIFWVLLVEDSTLSVEPLATGTTLTRETAFHNVWKSFVAYSAKMISRILGSKRNVIVIGRGHCSVTVVVSHRNAVFVLSTILNGRRLIACDSELVIVISVCVVGRKPRSVVLQPRASHNLFIGFNAGTCALVIVTVVIAVRCFIGFNAGTCALVIVIACIAVRTTGSAIALAACWATDFEG